MFKELLEKVWQGRFRRGVDVGFGGFNVTRYDNKAVSLSMSAITIASVGSNHWPFKTFEFKFVTGSITMWHVCIMGMLFGVSRKHDLDKEGNIAGPDKRFFYSAFSCINHFNQSFTEVIDN